MHYHSPASFQEAVEIAQYAKGITRFLAGGTDVLVQLRADVVTPDTLIDIKGIPGVKDIACTPQEWTIGVAVSGAELSEHPDLKNEWPGLVEAMNLIGSTQVQGRATLVGNLCNGSPAADSVPALVASGATVTVCGPMGTRRVAVSDIPVAPGKTSLEKGEVISAIHVPRQPPRAADAYLRFIPRTEMDIAVVGCAVNLASDDTGAVSAATVALGAVAPTVRLAPDAAAVLVGSRLSDATLKLFADEIAKYCAPITDKRGTVEFRTEVAGVMAKRAAIIAYQRATGAAK